MPVKKVSLDTTDKKPSLASLKPDKAKGVAAKKKAVKRIDAASSTKSPSKKGRNATIKKMSENKISAAEGKRVITTEVKSVPLQTKKVTKSTTSTPRKAAPVVAEKTEFSVKLPTNMSIRAREKALVILHSVSQDFKEPMKRIVYVSSFAFLLLGSALALSASFVSPIDSLLSANLASTTNTLDGTTNTTTIASYAKPVFSSSEKVPTTLASDFSYTFMVTNAKNVNAKLYALTAGEKISLNIEQVTTDTYRVLIKVSSLTPGEYEVLLSAESKYDSSLSTYDAGTFVVPSANPVSNTETVSGSETTTGTATSSDTTVSSTANTESTEVPATEAVVAETPVLDTLYPKLIIEGGDFTKREVVKVAAPKDTRLVEVSIRPLKSINSWFLGSAVQGTEYWYFFFDTLKVPNGEYELFARTRGTANYLSTDTKKIRVANEVATTLVETTIATTPETITPVEPKEVVSEEDVAEKVEEESVMVTQDSVRSFSEIQTKDLSDEASSSMIVPTETKDQIDGVLSDYKEELSELLKRYAVAQQSGDSMLIEIAQKKLLESKEALVTSMLSNADTNHLADDIERMLTERFDALKKRVDTFEQLRRSANSDDISVDTDQDGISDFDEKNLYRTSIEHADTDNDGVLDGIEIMRGFDPLNSASEAVIVYEMPQDTIALVQEETLKIDTVLPIVQTNTEGDALPVFAEIRGKALPNSFVTLYVFSTPTIVTVRTDNDGSFVYTFEKELEDGQHEVYIAVTDNAGAIMARSNPFTFIKEAQAFTSVGANGNDIANSQSLSEFTNVNSYNIAVGLGILAFGLILLMLGVSLREKDEAIVITKPAHDLKTS